MSFNKNLDKVYAPSHQHMEEKKSRKRRISTNPLGSAKKQRLSRRPAKNGITLGDSSTVEPQPLPNGVSSLSPHPDSKDPGIGNKSLEQDDNLKIDGPIRYEPQSEPHANSNGNQNFVPRSQVALLDKTELQSRPSLTQGDYPMKSVEQLASGRLPDKTEKMVLRTRTQSITRPLANPKEVIGRRIKVWWPRDSAYYWGVIRVFDAKRRKHKVVYDDGDVEWLCLEREKYALESNTEKKPDEMGDVPHTTEEQKDQKLGMSTRKRVGSKTFSDIKAAVAAVKTQKDSELSARKQKLKDQKLGVSTRKRGAGKTVSDINAAVAAAKTQKDGELSARKRKFQERTANHIRKGQTGCVYMRKRKKPRRRPRVPKDMETFSNTPSPPVTADGRQLKRSARRKAQKYAEAERMSTTSHKFMVDTMSAGPVENKAGPAGVNGRPVRRVKKTYKLNSLTQAGAALFGHKGHKEAVLTDLVMPMSSGLSPHHEESQLMIASDCFSGVRKKNITNKMELRGVGRKLFTRNPLLGALRRQNKCKRTKRKRCPPSQDFPTSNKRLRMTVEKAEMRQRGGASYFSGQLVLEKQTSTSLGVQDFTPKCRTTESCSPNPLKAFHFTIHLPRPVMVTSFLTWPLFNMLRTIGLCGGERFEGRFLWRGSARDFADIALLLMSVIKSLPFDCQRHSQHWRGRMLHDFWAAASRRSKQWARKLPAVLSPRADNMLMKHMRQLMKQGEGNERFTFKQVLSLFFCYIIKPFLIAMVCERGAQPILVVEQFLVCVSSVRKLSFRRQSIKWVKLSPCGRAEVDFLSYLSHFPSCSQWCTANDILHKLAIEQCGDFMVDKGFSKLLVLAPSFNFSGDQGLQFLTSVIKFIPVCVNRTFGLQMKNSGLDGFVRTFPMDRLAVTEATGDFRSILHSESSLDLYTGLCLASIMQKYLLTVVGGWCRMRKSSKRPTPGPAQEDCMLKCSLHHTEGMADDDGMLLVGQELSDVVHGARTIDHSSSFTADEIMVGSRMEVFRSPKQTLGADCEINDSMLSAMGSSSNLSLECDTQWKGASMAKVGFKSINNMGDSHGTSPRHREHGDTSHLFRTHGSRKRSGTKRRPRRVSLEGTTEADGRELKPCCSANVLVTDKDRSWREVAVKVELQSNGNDWVIWVHREGAPCSHKIVDRAVTTRVNRHTQAIMWKSCDGWMLEFSDREQWMHFKRIHEECSHRNARAPCMRQIPIPSWRLVKERAESTPWSRVTPGMIRRAHGEVEVAVTCTHDVYDVDSEDEHWLEEMNSRAEYVEEPISIETFEHIVDKLERITYLRRGHIVAPTELVDLCQNSGYEGVVLAVHAYWSNKLATKNNFLVRYYQVPLWKKYYEQHERWELQVNELRKQWPTPTEEELHHLCPKPAMFSYCMQSRNVDMSNMSKRVQRQRSQKHLHSSFKQSRVPVSGYAEGFSLPRSHVAISSPEASLYGDGSDNTHSEYPSGYSEMSYWARKKLEKVLWEQLASCLSPHRAASDHHRRAEEAQAKATAARKIAAARAAKAQAQFLRFSLALQRAVAALMEFKMRYDADAAFLSVEWLEASRKLLEKRVNHLFGISELLGDDSSIDNGSNNDDADGGGGGHKQGADDDGDDGHNDEDDDDYSGNDSEEDGFRELLSVDDLRREEACSLSVTERANLEALMRRTLRRRTR